MLLLAAADLRDRNPAARPTLLCQVLSRLPKGPRLGPQYLGGRVRPGPKVLAAQEQRVEPVRTSRPGGRGSCQTPMKRSSCGFIRGTLVGWLRKGPSQQIQHLKSSPKPRPARRCSTVVGPTI